MTSAAAYWARVRADLEAASAGSHVTVDRAAPAPAEAGARRDIGLPFGQLADWRFPPAADCTGMHVHEHADRYEAHLDRVHPACSLIGHVRADAPQVLVIGGAAAGAWLAVAGGGGLRGAVAGVVLGALAGGVAAGRRG